MEPIEIKVLYNTSIVFLKKFKAKEIVTLTIKNSMNKMAHDLPSFFGQDTLVESSLAPRRMLLYNSHLRYCQGIKLRRKNLLEGGL